MNFNNLFYNLFLNKYIKYVIISIIKQNINKYTYLQIKLFTKKNFSKKEN